MSLHVEAAVDAVLEIVEQDGAAEVICKHGLLVYLFMEFFRSSTNPGSNPDRSWIFMEIVPESILNRTNTRNCAGPAAVAFPEWGSPLVVGGAPRGWSDHYFGWSDRA